MYSHTSLCNILILISCFVQAGRPVHDLHTRSEKAESGDCRAVNFKYPHDCSEGACDFTLQWVESEQRVNFTLTAVVSDSSSVWTAAGFSHDGHKVDIAICCLDENGIPSIHAAHSRHGMSHMTPSHHSELILTEIKANNDMITCSFSRLTQTVTLSLTEPVFVLLASGTSKSGNSKTLLWPRDGDGILRQALFDVNPPILGSHELHTSKEGSSECRLDVTSCVENGEKCDSCDWFRMLLLKLHGIIMTITFVLLLPTAVVIARYYRVVFSGSWFMAHKSLMVISVVWIVIGFAFILGHTRGRFSFGIHQMVGITCICLSLVQPIYGFLRPPVGPTLKRKVFTLVHRTLGVTIITLGILALFLGSYLIQEYSMMSVFSLFVLVSISCMALLEYLTRTNRFVTPPVGYQKVTKDELSESEEEVFVKEEGGKKEGGARASEKGQPMFRMEKGILVVFILQGFTFSGIIGAFLFHSGSQDHV